MPTECEHGNIIDGGDFPGVVNGCAECDIPVTTSPDPKTIITGASYELSLISLKCNAPAPCVVNGASFIGCSEDRNHQGQHRIEISWGE